MREVPAFRRVRRAVRAFFAIAINADDPTRTWSSMSEEALAALGTEKAFSVCTAFIKSGGSDGKGTGVSNIPGQGQEERKVRHAASHSAPRSALPGRHRPVA